jgi:hypothetical protein
MTSVSGPVRARRGCWLRRAPGSAVAPLAASRNAVLALALAGALAGLGAPAQAQDKPQPGTTKNDEDVVKAGTRDPYTDGEPKLMADAGIVAYAPFPWADGQRTTDVDRVLGERRILWLETPHFRIGCNLASAPMPVAQDQRKYLLDELKRLKKKLPRIDDKPKRLDPWLRAHLYAQRAEELYAEFQQLCSVTDADFGNGTEPGKGKYLGLPDKYLLLLFQKKSDLARYLDRFCGVQGERSYRFYHKRSNQMLAAIAAEGLEGADELGLLSHTIYSLVNNLVISYQGYWYELPIWFTEGLSHWYSRRVPTEFVNVVAKDDEALNEEQQHEWPPKVRRRAAFSRGWLTFAQLDGLAQHADCGYQAHIMAWSRVDYLMSVDHAKVGRMLVGLKGLPLATDGMVAPGAVQAQETRLLADLFGLDGAAFDQRWRDFVLKTYPKK